MPRKRSAEARVRRAARRFIRLNAYADRRVGEGVARCSRQALLDHIADLQEHNGLGLESLAGVEETLGKIAEVEKGLILWDSRGRGVYQKVDVTKDARRIK